MLSGKIPVVRLQIQALGEEIHAAIMAHGNEVAEEVKKGVKAATENLDIIGIAQKAAEEAIAESINSSVKRYFEYGEGREIIDQMVGKSISRGGE